MNKQELLEEIVKLDIEVSENFPHYDLVGKEVVLALIDQLDEPEVLSQEWIDEHAKAVTYDGIPDQTEIVYVDDLQNLLVPKQEKPVIPQFVADWIDTHNLYGSNPLKVYRDLDIDFNEGWTDEKDAAVYHWINKNPYAFIDALRYGCEVEKEQKYHVVNKEDYFMLRKYDGLVDILHVSSTMSRDEYGKDTSFMLTEKEIKDYDERYWAFAQEVTK